MSEELKRLRQQQQAQAAQLQRMQMQMQSRPPQQEDFDEEEVVFHKPLPQQQTQQVNQTQEQAVLQHLTNAAAAQASVQVQQNMQATNDIQEQVKKRMQRLTNDYPALTDENSDLVIKSRDVYARINAETPHLDQATKYELSVREAASAIGARPVNAPIEDVIRDFTMPAGTNQSIGRRKGSKSRLNDKIIQNAVLMGINVDPGTLEGKKNLAELSEYSERFNADQDETAYRYR